MAHGPGHDLKLPAILHLFNEMDPFVSDLIEDDFDLLDEETRQEVNDYYENDEYYDDLSDSLSFNSSFDF